MKLGKLKLFAAALTILPMFAIASFNAKSVSAVAATAVDDDAAATYKTKCAMCHSPKAEKFFDATKTDDVLTDTILKGKKGEKPPFMPAFGEKGVTADQAKALATYMKSLKTAGN